MCAQFDSHPFSYLKSIWFDRKIVVRATLELKQIFELSTFILLSIRQPLKMQVNLHMQHSLFNASNSSDEREMACTIVAQLKIENINPLKLA